MTKGQIAMVAAMVNNYHRAGIRMPAGRPGTAKTSEDSAFRGGKAQCDHGE
jgi:hypothetical protein